MSKKDKIQKPDVAPCERMTWSKFVSNVLINDMKRLQGRYGFEFDDPKLAEPWYKFIMMMRYNGTIDGRKFKEMLSESIEIDFNKIKPEVTYQLTNTEFTLGV